MTFLKPEGGGYWAGPHPTDYRSSMELRREVRYGTVAFRLIREGRR